MTLPLLRLTVLSPHESVRYCYGLHDRSAERGIRMGVGCMSPQGNVLM